MKKRFVALTDIYRLPEDKQVEIDDVESMIRLLLYADNIDIEGLIATSSFCLKNGGTEKEKKVILDIIDGYEKVLPNLRVHSKEYPDADYLRSITKHGINVFGKKYGSGFGEDKYSNNEGVRLIMDIMEKEDDRPVWFGLWGGCNTLAQAIWQLEKSHSADQFDKLIRKIRIYGISDQDKGGIWLRERYGERLFYVVSPSNGSGIVLLNGAGFMGATWTGMCWDGGKMADYAKGFEAADTEFVTKEWIRKHICGEGDYQRLYPEPIQGMEGDTPTYLGLIENGLNDMEHPNWGSWGGRYEYKMPDSYPAFCKKEKYLIWTDAVDTYTGKNGSTVSNGVCSLYRWRKDFQHDFEARMQWTLTGDYAGANHAPVVKVDCEKQIRVKPGQKVYISAEGSYDPDDGRLEYEWFEYFEAGTNPEHMVIENPNGARMSCVAPSREGTTHVILRVTDDGSPSLASYARIIICTES